ncbi:hypothetical protein GM921_12810 [Pedobacter sp. LMG 31464]|uniref:Uncharacterized protein n=1 Tax=Pedobacter planticolens TaxID=2679964 RepID=A0A923DYF7_9SPHI|nr:hypothetical protein [Pedobacter planticolens]MBB2146374.1 hypothetical protein [Pedobacter planticolens]
MKTLNLKEMEVIEGGKLCSSEGLALVGMIGGPVLGAALFAGAWIGCSI